MHLGDKGGSVATEDMTVNEKIVLAAEQWRSLILTDLQQGHKTIFQQRFEFNDISNSAKELRIKAINCFAAVIVSELKQDGLFLSSHRTLPDIVDK